MTPTITNAILIIYVVIVGAIVLGVIAGIKRELSSDHAATKSQYPLVSSPRRQVLWRIYQIAVFFGTASAMIYWRESDPEISMGGPAILFAGFMAMLLATAAMHYLIRFFQLLKPPKASRNPPGFRPRVRDRKFSHRRGR